MIKCGLPENKRDNVIFNNRGTASVRNLDNSECLFLISAIHGKRNFDRKLYCNGIVPLTPEKECDSQAGGLAQAGGQDETLGHGEAGGQDQAGGHGEAGGQNLAASTNHAEVSE